MKFRCGHCNHVFILNNEDLRRCPKCFWTTALDPILDGDEGSKPQPVIKNKKPVSPAGKQDQTNWLPLLGMGALLLIVAGMIVAAGIFFLPRIHPMEKLASIRLPSFLGLKTEKKPIEKRLPSSSTAPSNTAKPAAALTDEEKKELLIPFQISIPRILSKEEMEIIKKQVPSPAGLTTKPKMSFWSLEDFKKMLKTAQDQRKIPLGFFYVHAVNKVFESGYLKAAQFYEQGDYVQARNSLIEGLVLPVYQGDQLTNRAVALVMLRPYINDVLGKLSVIQGYFAYQQTADELRNIYKLYQDLLSALDLHDWGKSEDLIAQTLNQINQVNVVAQPARPMQYPPVFAQVDQEIQNAILREAGTGKPPAQVSDLTALKADLEAKAKVARENKEEALIAVQKQYEQAVDDIKQQNWQAAYDKLKEISYPEELVENVRKKMEILGKLLSESKNQDSGANQGG